MDPAKDGASLDSPEDSCLYNSKFVLESSLETEAPEAIQGRRGGTASRKRASYIYYFGKQAEKPKFKK